MNNFPPRAKLNRYSPKQRLDIGTAEQTATIPKLIPVDDVSTHLRLASAVLHSSPEVQLGYFKEISHLVIKLSPKLTEKELQEFICRLLAENANNLSHEFAANLVGRILLSSNKRNLMSQEGTD